MFRPRMEFWADPQAKPSTETDPACGEVLHCQCLGNACGVGRRSRSARTFVSISFTKGRGFASSFLDSFPSLFSALDGAADMAPLAPFSFPRTRRVQGTRRAPGLMPKRLSIVIARREIFGEKNRRPPADAQGARRLRHGGPFWR